MKITRANEAEAIAYCKRRNAKIAQRDGGVWVILDMESTPFWWAVFISEGDAALAYMQYRFDLADARYYGAER